MWVELPLMSGGIAYVDVHAITALVGDDDRGATYVHLHGTDVYVALRIGELMLRIRAHRE